MEALTVVDCLFTTRTLFNPSANLLPHETVNHTKDIQSRDEILTARDGNCRYQGKVNTRRRETSCSRAISQHVDVQPFGKIKDTESLVKTATSRLRLRAIQRNREKPTIDYTKKPDAECASSKNEESNFLTN